MEGLKKRSGEVESNDPLVGFLYLLIRDHLPTGIIESIMKDVSNMSTYFTNGWLANYSKDVAERLRKED